MPRSGPVSLPEASGAAPVSPIVLECCIRVVSNPQCWETVARDSSSSAAPR
jgi:hypothetical protein